MEITKIVMTGGPCAGKSTAMSWVQETFTKKGYVVLFVPETATELISSGVAPWTCGTNFDYQFCQARLQLAKEQVFEQAAQSMTQTQKVLVVCDRGLLDNKAYMTQEEFETVLEALHTNEVVARDSYDAVFHLVSAAKGAEEFYTTANNNARTETIAEAAELDNKLIAAWTGHPHLRIIDNEGSFEDKMKHLIAEISAFLGEPQPYQIERKYLIEYPDISLLEMLPNCQRVEIIQTYLTSENGDEIRIRQRGINGNYVYTQTTKTMVNGIKRIEVERRLTQNEYLRLLMNSDISKRQIRKTRYCLASGNQYYKIDIFPFWDNQAILEVELPSETTPVQIPPNITVIREVTYDPAYKNAALATR